MNHFARIALAAGLLAAPMMPAFAQNGTPMTGTTSPTPSTQAPSTQAPSTQAPSTQAPVATHAATMPKTHHTAKLTVKKPATPVSAPASSAKPASTKTP